MQFTRRPYQQNNFPKTQNIRYNKPTPQFETNLDYYDEYDDQFLNDKSVERYPSYDATNEYNAKQKDVKPYLGVYDPYADLNRGKNNFLKFKVFSSQCARLRNLELFSTANVGCVNLMVFCSGGVHSQRYQIGFLKLFR